MLQFLLLWAALAIPVLVLWRIDERRARSVARIEASVARDERRIRRLIAAHGSDAEIIARYPDLHAHHVAAVRARMNRQGPSPAAGERRLRDYLFWKKRD